MYRTYTHSDSDALIALHASAFGTSPSSVGSWHQRVGHDNLRVWDRHGVVGAAVDIPMAASVGGRQVPLHGVAGVAVCPTARRQGIARRMMTAYLNELAERRVALSALFASSRTLYDRVGYGIAGQSYRYSIDTDVLRRHGDSGGSWRAVGDSERRDIEAARADLDRYRPFALRRGPYLWSRIWSPESGPTTGYALYDDAGLAAWVVMSQRQDGEWLTQSLADHGARNSAALAKLTGFIGGFSSMTRTTVLRGGPACALFDRLPEHRHTQVLVEPWMLRIVDIVSAISCRGWPALVTGEAHLQLVDDTLPEQSGRWVLSVHGGSAHIKRGGSGAISLDIQGLSTLYSGAATPHHLNQTAHLSADPPALVNLAALFAGPSPDMCDFF